MAEGVEVRAQVRRWRSVHLAAVIVVGVCVWLVYEVWRWLGDEFPEGRARPKAEEVSR